MEDFLTRLISMGPSNIFTDQHELIETDSFKYLRRVLLEKVTTAQPSYMKKFARLKTQHECVTEVLSQLKQYNLIPEFQKDEKDDKLAESVREQGNKLFARNKLKEAWKLYTDSIAFAPKGGKNMAFAYGNRSAVFHVMGLHKECLEDISRALEYCSDSKLKEKLLSRREKSQQLLKPPESYYEQVPEIAPEHRNALIESAANCVEIRTSKKFGRHIVATRDIEIGEVLAMEKPFVVSIRSENALFSHCHYCIELCYNLIPCDSCTEAMYCSENCKSRAFGAYHKYECPILKSVRNINVTNSHHMLPFRLLLSIRDEFANMSQLETLKKGEMYHSSRYKEVHNLQSHADKKPVEMRFGLAALTGLVLEIVKNHSSFFHDLTDVGDKENIFKELFMQHCLTVHLNGLDVSENTKVGSGKVAQSIIGPGIYPFMALLNHSCTSNVFVTNHGSTMVLRAIKTIKKGQQCFIVYNSGAHFEDTPKVAREEVLKDYHIECTCIACRKDWPQYKQMRMLDDFNYPMEFLQHNGFTLDGSDEVAKAKRMLPKLVEKLKEIEKFEPCVNVFVIKEEVLHCYEFLGNKRRFF